MLVKMMPIRIRPIFCLLVIFSFLLLNSCAETQVGAKTIVANYNLALYYIDIENYTQAKTLLSDITENYPETKYANYAYLKLGDIAMREGSSADDIKTAEENYKIFLRQNASSHLVPYALAKLIELNFDKTKSILFGDSYAAKRSSEPFKNIINAYERFYLMYPHNLYLQDSQKYLTLSKQYLSEHEDNIGNWYYDQELYASAIARYLYLLKYYPGYKDKNLVLKKIILAYKKIKQPKQAEKWQAILNQYASLNHNVTQ